MTTIPTPHAVMRIARAEAAQELATMDAKEQMNVHRLMRELKAIAHAHGEDGRIALVILGVDEIIGSLRR